ncbi:hypothetical protein LUZ60_001835 [Juncus effusus]|nr:hypothetical protein LUZ60_001835 [Juncus effusus]
MASLSFPITSNSQAHSRITIPSLLPQIRIAIKKDPQFLKFSLRNHAQVISSASKTSSIPQLNPNSKEEEEIQKGSLYRFFSQTGGTVKVLVQDQQNETYKVKIEVSEKSSNELTLNWGTYQSDSSQLKNPNGTGTIKTPFTNISSEKYCTEIEFDNSTKSPFYLSFVMLDRKNNNSEIKTQKGTNFCVPIGIGCGDPVPLGFSYSKSGNSNFALFSKNAESVILCLYQTGNNEPSLELELDRYINRTGDIWHISLNNIEKYDRYGFRCKGPLDWKKGGRFHMKNVLLDPYAKNISDFAPDQGKKVSFAKCLGFLDREGNNFNWNCDRNPNLAMEKLVVYRLNVGLFTKEKSFKGLIEKIPHFKQLGVNAILLEPIFSFDERKGPFYPYHFFSPMKQFGSIESLKEMIKCMHAKGIEVILEVSFCNTSEGNDKKPQMISFRGIDNLSYYHKNGGLNCKSRVVQTLILDCLRFWVCEFHIDGFSFVDSNYLLKNEEITSRSALIESIAFDPILSKTKLIADSSSPINPKTYMNSKFPHWKRWAEMNSKFCTDIRSFIKGEGVLSNLATRLCGSGDVFLSRGPSFCFNYVTRNFGLTLVDLMSFSNENEVSWNCGAEGATDCAIVLETRLKHIRNILFILFVSIGVPVINMGDELGYSTGGKIAYNDRKEINWTTLESDFGKQITQFINYLTELRSRRPALFQRKEFLKLENIIWRGTGDLQSEPDWADSTCKILSMMVKGEEEESGNEIPVFVGFNGGEKLGNVFLPEGFEWVRLVDTGLPFPGFFVGKIESLCEVGGGMSYEVKPHSCVLFEAKRKVSCDE